MYYTFLIILAIIIYCYEARRPRIVLSSIPPMFEYYLEPISYNVTSFEIADLDLFRLKLYKDKISNKESAIEQILSTFTLERLYNISRMYPMSDQDYYFTILVNHLINDKKTIL